MMGVGSSAREKEETASKTFSTEIFSSQVQAFRHISIKRHVSQGVEMTLTSIDGTNRQGNSKEKCKRMDFSRGSASRPIRINKGLD